MQDAARKPLDHRKPGGQKPARPAILALARALAEITVEDESAGPAQRVTYLTSKAAE